MSTIYHENHPVLVQSLVERKKQQWAREREELAGLNENVPWGSRDSLQLYDRPYIKTRYVTKYQKESEYLRRDSSYSTSSSATSVHAPVSGTPRRQPPTSTNQHHQQYNSLPPLYKNQNFTYSPDEKFDKEMGGETSGYGSDNAQHTPEHFPQTANQHGQPWSTPSSTQHHQLIVNANHANVANGYESSSSGREDRLKWGKYWEPTSGATKDVINQTNDTTPGWVKRGLERDTELVVVNNSSPAESPEQDYGERPCTSSSTQTNRCHIRGQNVPVEPAELAERERRRQIALAHQEAIRQQLEEREKRRAEERARKVREEHEEELRIAREQGMERERQEREEQLRREKEEREWKRKEALREAIEIAEKEAKAEKVKLRLMRQNQLNMMNYEHEKTIDKDIKNRTNQNNQQQQLQYQELTKEIEVPPKQHNFYNKNDNITREKMEKSDEIIKEQINPKISTPNNDDIDKSVDTQLVLANQNTNKTYSSTSSESNDTSVPSSAMVHPLQTLHSLPSLSHDNLAVILQNPLSESLQNVQFVLIPTLSQQIPIPISSAVQTVVSTTTRTENRLLTPTQYRNKRQTCDSSTQTDLPDYRKELCDKLANIEISYESRSRKERRSRSEMRHGDMVEAQERPKWGVNRPPTRYLKQSEKDPLYQRRKLRQKMRQVKTYDDKRYSSDDSQTGSPRTYRKKRGVWRKDDALYAENVKVYQTEIIPLDSDKDHIYFRTKAHHQCCCRCVGSGPDPGPATGLGNYNREVNRDRVDIMKVETPREYRDRLPVCNNNNYDDGILDKLTSIHNDLMLKDNWEDRNQILYSPSRNP